MKKSKGNWFMCISLSCLLFSVKSMCSSGASNIGSLLSGIGTIILAIVGIITLCWGTVTFSRWKKENRSRKVSDVAVIEFDTINTLEQDILNWLKYATSIFVFNRHSDANQKKYETLSPENQKKLSDSWDTDEYELVNYSRKGSDIMARIIFAKKRATLFKNNQIRDSFGELLKLVKTSIDNLNIYHFPGMDKQGKIKAMKALAPDQNQKMIGDLFESIRGALIEYVMFDK